MVNSASYKLKHSMFPKLFTRERKLPFKTVMQLLLRKSVKPLQLILNEWTDYLDYEISSSALSQARQKLKHTAFIELHKKCVVEVMYGEGNYNRYKGHRLLAIDGTSLRLPNTEELREEFGLIVHMSEKKKLASNQVEAKALFIYDVLNEIPVSADLFPGRTNELKASRSQLKTLQEQDILIADRGYGSYRFFAEIIEKEADFIIRCKDKTFKRHHGLLQSKRRKENIVEIPAPIAVLKEGLLPLKLKIRFIRIELDNGEVEILATSLLNTKKFPYSDFKSLYYKRWGIETYFQTLKSRLTIDNFTGKSLNAVLQDFYATVFVSGLETIITSEAETELGKNKTKYKRRVNKAIAFHTIKNKIIKMVFDPRPDNEAKILRLFLQNPNLVRPHRPKPPRTPSARNNNNRNSLYFQRYARKHVF